MAAPVGAVADHSADRLAAAVYSPAGVAALLSAYAGVIHLSLAPGHLGDSGAHAAFFAAVGALQVATALATALAAGRAPGKLVVLGAIALNVGTVLVWLVSRTVGVPVGHAAGHGSGGEPEAVRLLDLTVTVAELVVVVALVAVLPPAVRRRTLNVLALVGAGLWAARVAGVLA